MASTIGSYPVVTNTITATATLAANRFVEDDGTYPSAGGTAHGVTRQAGVSGDLIPVDAVGTTIVEAGGAIAKGGPVKSDAAGKAVAQGGSGTILGRALSAAAADTDLIEVLLIANA